ncbi:MAG: membrane dipeptidase [Clostridia bacterium]|nr:membrane dipeptidase [Clostridia bacterium]
MNYIYDLHNDYFTSIKSARVKNKYLSSAQKVAKTLATVVWTTEFDAQKSLETIKRAKILTGERDFTFLAIEDLGFASKQSLLEIANENPKYCGLTWNYNNNLAGGALEYGDLSEFGKFAIKLFETRNICIDTAHLNEKSFMSLATITEKPMLCSHTASYFINNHPRNLKDYQIKIIADSGGIVGLSLVSEFLSGKKKSTLDDYVKHVDYLVNKFGIEHFAIGTDFYGTKHLPKGIKNYFDLEKKLTEKLTNLGYTKDDILKLFYQNAEKFFN